MTKYLVSPRMHCRSDIMQIDSVVIKINSELTIEAIPIPDLNMMFTTVSWISNVNVRICSSSAYLPVASNGQ